MEQAISALAPQARREAFETPAEQIGFLSGGPQDEQLASLRETMAEMEDKPDEFETLVKAWMSSDMATLTHEALDPLRKSSPDLFRRLVTDRNARWTQVLDARGLRTLDRIAGVRDLFLRSRARLSDGEAAVEASP